MAALATDGDGQTFRRFKQIYMVSKNEHIKVKYLIYTSFSTNRFTGV